MAEEISLVGHRRLALPARAQRLARQRLVERSIENAIGLREEVNQLGDPPTDIAQLANEGDVRRLNSRPAGAPPACRSGRKCRPP
jgi:hypothetical protein